MTNGFTLIELLAVIVILAIILLIATPMIVSVIENVKKGAFESTAKFIVDAAELEYFSSGNNEKAFSIEDGAFVGDVLDLNGKIPQNGQILIDSSGKVALALHDGKYCASKDFLGEVQVVEALEADCTLVMPDTGPYFVKLLVDELNSTITSAAQLEAIDWNQLQSIINAAVIDEPNFYVSDETYSYLISLAGSNKEYEVSEYGLEYRLTYLTNINTNKAFLLRLSANSLKWTPRNISEYNEFAKEIPPHEILIEWATPQIYSSWDASVQTEASDNSHSIYVLIAYNNVTNQFETYLNMMRPE